jgi:hypothetical protein
MNAQSVTFSKTCLLKILFILSILACLIKIESIVYSSIDYQKHQVRSTSELVVFTSKYNYANLPKLFSSSDGYLNFQNIPSGQSFFYKCALFHYNNFLQIHFKVLNNNLRTLQQFYNSFHKDNISHKSSEEDSLC